MGEIFVTIKKEVKKRICNVCRRDVDCINLCQKDDVDICKECIKAMNKAISESEVKLNNES